MIRLYLAPFLLTCTLAFTSPSFLKVHRHGDSYGSLYVSDITESSTSLFMAGFGGSSSSSKKKGKRDKKTTVVLKPKQQWDRFLSWKKSTSVMVAVRVANDDSTLGQWLEVGKIKSEDDKYTEIAVVSQRGIIAEHSKRLYPLKVLPKDKVEWGFSSSSTPEQGDWSLANKDVLSDAPAGVEKLVGFEGKPDPSSGFYCHYENGRMIDKYGSSDPVQ